MIVLAQISDIDDIEQKSFTNQQTGEVVVSGSITLTTSKPTRVNVVKVSPELWKESQGGKHFESFVGKQLNYQIEMRDYSYMQGDQLRQGTSVNLFRLPKQENQK
ncbi:hypothetical protein [Vibrio rotiferianus]|uniref:hypothetical protein n=1 Tax=Vibrio rotiferianus TaxID=190895 RepID=UPI0002378135|nr:hypothetical protein [Vibrio rotiferianus]